MTTPTLTEFRKPHPIDPVPVWLPGGTEYDHTACDVCGVEVYAVRDGSWRHVAEATRTLPRPATWPGVA